MPQRNLVKCIRENSSFYLFIAPFFIPFIIFWIWPLAHSFYLSLTNWSGFGDPKFIGAKNYIKLIDDVSFHDALGNTILFTVIAVPIQIIFGLILARLLKEKMVRLKPFFRVIFLTPFIISPIIVGTIFLFLLDSNFGVLNYFLISLGVKPIPWLITPFWMRVSIIILSVWKWTGWTAVIFLAGMQNNSPELEESAKIDGASELQIFIWITIPMLSHLLLFTTVIGTIGGFQLFAEPLALSANQKGPEDSAYTLVYAIWRNAFEFGQFGKAAAMGYVLFFITMAITFIQFYFNKKREVV